MNANKMTLLITSMVILFANAHGHVSSPPKIKTHDEIRRDLLSDHYGTSVSAARLIVPMASSEPELVEMALNNSFPHARALGAMALVQCITLIFA